MHTKTMEGLVGARTSMNLMNTPFRVFKEARRKGDTATMERAMGYVNDFSDKAWEYKAKADEGMEEDAKEAKEKAELARENVIEKRREEQEAFEKKIAAEKAQDTDTIEISTDGKVMLKECVDSDRDVTIEPTTDVVKKEPVIYTQSGETIQSQPQTGGTVSVSV